MEKAQSRRRKNPDIDPMNPGPPEISSGGIFTAKNKRRYATLPTIARMVYFADYAFRNKLGSIDTNIRTMPLISEGREEVGYCLDDILRIPELRNL